MDASNLSKFISCLALGLAACSPKAVGILSDHYDFSHIKRVALVSFSDYPGAIGSGEITASTFEAHLLKAGYSVVERRQINKVFNEQAFGLTGSFDPAAMRKLGKLLGVQAIVLGVVTDFFNIRDHTLFINGLPGQNKSIFGEMITVRPTGPIKTVQNTRTGYEYDVKDRLVPNIENLPAYVGLSVRLVDVQTGEVVWSASASGGANDMTAASQKVCSTIMQTVSKEMKRH